TENVVYPLANHNTPTTREPVFAPTTQFLASTGSPTIGDVVLVPLLDPFPRFLLRADTNTTVPVRIFSPLDAGRFVFIAAAGGRNTGFPLGDGRIVPLNNDSVLAFSLSVPNPVFTNFGQIVGPLDADGIYEGASIQIPFVDGNEGRFFYTAFVVLDAS